MRIITRKRLYAFAQTHPESRNSIERWHSIVRRTEFDNFNSIEDFFPDADSVGNFVIFNIGGNKYRVAAKIAYKAKIVYIRHVMTHDEYTKGSWKNDPWFRK